MTDFFPPVVYTLFEEDAFGCTKKRLRLFYSLTLDTPHSEVLSKAEVAYFTTDFLRKRDLDLFWIFLLSTLLF